MINTADRYFDCVSNVAIYGYEESIRRAKYPMSTDLSTVSSELTPGIKKIMSSNPGEGHDVSLTGIVVQFDLTFTNKAWVEFERYHFADFISSQSTMHKIAKFNLDNAYNEYVDPRVIEIMKEKVEAYNNASDTEDAKRKYLEVLYTNPSGFKLTAGITTNYRQLKTIYKQRKNHTLPEWRNFCKWIESLPGSDMITGKGNNEDV